LQSGFAARRATRLAITGGNTDRRQQGACRHARMAQRGAAALRFEALSFAPAAAC
jgi:hypothetical protein